MRMVLLVALFEVSFCIAMCNYPHDSTIFAIDVSTIFVLIKSANLSDSSFLLIKMCRWEELHGAMAFISAEPLTRSLTFVVSY